MSDKLTGDLTAEAEAQVAELDEEERELLRACISAREADEARL